MAPLVTVIVPAYNASSTIAETLEALADQRLDGDYEVIVVDNGSEDETAVIAERAPGAVRVVRKELGRAGSARNRGVAVGSGEILAFTDADCRPRPNWLEAGLAAIAGSDLVQGVVRPDARKTIEPFDRTVVVGADDGLYQTANLLIRRAAFERAGGFEDRIEADIASPFGEDVILGWRARRQGARATFSRETVVEHAVFGRSWRGFIAERRRLAYFPVLVAEVPEIRSSFLVGRIFLTRRSAAFDLAVFAAAVAPRLGFRAAALGAVPYAVIAIRGASRWRRRAPWVLAVEVIADAAGLLALGWGSLRARSPVL